MIRATKVNIQKQIISAVESAAIESYESTGVHIRKMPEYYLNVLIAHSLTKAFPSLGYRLEMPVKEALTSLGLKHAENSLELRDGGRFDVVLTSKKSRKLRHVIEVKRSLSNRQLLKEAKRLKALAMEAHQSKRLETAYIAAISRLRNRPRSSDIDQLLDSRLDKVQEFLGRDMTISCHYQILDPGSVGFSEDEALIIAVFCLQKREIT